MQRRRTCRRCHQEKPIERFRGEKGWLCKDCRNRAEAKRRAPHLGEQVGLVAISRVTPFLEELLIRCGGSKVEVARIVGVAPRTAYAWYSSKGTSSGKYRSPSGAPRLWIRRAQLQKVMVALLELRREHGQSRLHQASE